MERKLFVILLLISSLFITSSCTSDSKKSNDKSKIKVGVIMPLTGDIAFLGQSFTNAILMNADTSKVELFIEDTKGEPKNAVSIVKKMISVNNIDVAISLKPAISESINPILEKEGIPHFVFAFSPEITTASNVIKVYPSSDDEVLGYLNYANDQGFKNIVFLRHIFPDAELAFKTVVIPEAKKMNLNVTDIPFELSTKDFNNLAQKVKSNNPDLVVVQSLSYNFLNITKSFYNINILNKMLGDLNFGDLYTYDFSTVKEMDHIPFLGMAYVLSNKYETFEKEYNEKFKERPNIFAAFPYDVMTIINNLNKSELTKSDIINYYNNSETEGITGIIKFDSQGDQIINYKILEYADGKFIIHE